MTQQALASAANRSEVNTASLHVQWRSTWDSDPQVVGTARVYNRLRNRRGGEAGLMVLQHSLRICIVGLVAVSVACAANPPPELLQGLQQLVQQGDSGAARRQLQSALKKYPAEPGLFNLLGIVEAEQGNREQAETDFHKALALAPAFTGALLNLGRLYLQQASDPKARDRALAAFDKVLQYEAGNSEALYQSAALLRAAGAYSRSLARLNKLPPDLQSRAQVAAVRCADQVGLNQGDAAAATARILLQSDDLTSGDVLAIVPQIEAADEPLAGSMLEGLVTRQLAGREGQLQLGELYSKQKKLSLAREALDHAEQAGAPSANILVELAQVAYQQHDREGALGYLAQARDLEPGNAAIHFFFGVVCIELNLPLDARKSLDEAVRLNPDNPYYNYALGSVALHGRDPAQAVPYFEKYRLNKPKDPSGRFALGVARFYMADYEAASKDLRAVIGDQHSAPGAAYFLGRIAMLQQNLPEAEKELSQAVAADPNFADALAELGLLHIRLKRYDEASHDLDRAFKVDPENFRVNANLLILYQKTRDARVDQQQVRFEEIKKKRAEDEQLLYRTIEVRPY